MVLHRFTVAACAALVLGGLGLPASARAQAPSQPSSSSSSSSSVHALAVRPAAPGWKAHDTGTDEEFRGLAAVSNMNAWISGEAGTVLKTQDGGETWQDVSPPQAAGRALRDIEATDMMHAVTMSIGKGKHSRVFVTDDGGKTWDRAYTNHNSKAFYDCLAFSSDGTGLAVSDPVNGHFRLITSADGGHTWKLLVPKKIPRALKGEFGFAASGTCLVAGPDHEFWIASGGKHPRVFRTLDAGVTWTVTRTPIRGGASAGIYSVAFNGGNGVAVGGDYTDPTNPDQAAATSSDSGQSWTLSKSSVFGYRSGAAWANTHVVLAVGPTGSDASQNGGQTWKHFDDTSYDNVECTTRGACWASGSHGAVGSWMYGH